MGKIIAIILGAIALIGSVFYGKNQSDKRKAAEERAKKAEQEVKDMAVKAEVSETAHVDHVNEIGEIIATPDENLTETANDLFSSELSVGSKLKKARTDLRLSLLDASKKSGYTASRIAWIESDYQITADDITVLGKAYGLERSYINELKKQLRGSSSAKEDDK
ncbi:MAG: helix-turn-helix domain-containing protein [Spirochaetales bacterium]|nr:helix-turn-helix domain-containing protein [Spirochaetales bacterium]